MTFDVREQAESAPPSSEEKLLKAIFGVLSSVQSTSQRLRDVGAAQMREVADSFILAYRIDA